jgi:hypothetical protein
LVSFSREPALIPEGKDSHGSTIYMHNIAWTFTGDYFSTLEYLKQFDTLKWHLFWDDLSYRVSKYPQATVVIELHTITAVKEVEQPQHEKK